MDLNKIQNYLDDNRRFHLEEKNSKENRERDIYELNTIQKLNKSGYLACDLKYKKECYKFKYYKCVTLKSNKKLHRNLKLNYKDLVCLIELPFDFKVNKNKIFFDFKDRKIKLAEKDIYDNEEDVEYFNFNFTYGTVTKRNTFEIELIMRSENISKKKIDEQNNIFRDLRRNPFEKKNKKVKKKDLRHQKNNNYLEDDDEEDMEKNEEDFEGFNLNFSGKKKEYKYLIIKNPFDFLYDEYEKMLQILENFYSKQNTGSSLKIKNPDLITSLILKDNNFNNQNDTLKPEFIDAKINEEQKEIVIKAINVR